MALGGLLSRLQKRARGSIVAKNFIVHMANFGSQIVVQFLYFLIIAAVIGVPGYGVFASLLVLSLIGMIVVGIGCETTLIKNVAVERSRINDYFGHCLTSSLITFPIVSLFIVPIALYFYLDHMHWQSIIWILLADMIFTKLFHVSNNMFLGTQKPGYMLFLSMGASLTRMGALGAAALFTEDLTLDQWAVWYFAGQAMWGSICVATAISVFGPPNLFMSPREWGLGIQFTIDQGAQTGFKDIDKPAVLQAAGAEAAGIYTVAFRFVEAASTPVRALVYATYTRFFELAGDGRRRSVDFAFKVVPIAFGLAAAVGAGAIVLSLILPDAISMVFGPDAGAQFEPAMGYLRMLSPYPLFLALTFIGMDVLRATGRQGQRLVIVLSSVFVVLPVCYFGVQFAGLIGAIIGRVAVQAAAALAAWLIIWRGRKRDDETSVEQNDGSAVMPDASS